MTPERFREKVAYRRWQTAVNARDAVDVYDELRPALAAEADRLQRLWAKAWDATTAKENAR